MAQEGKALAGIQGTVCADACKQTRAAHARLHPLHYRESGTSSRPSSYDNATAGHRLETPRTTERFPDAKTPSMAKYQRPIPLNASNADSSS